MFELDIARNLQNQPVELLANMANRHGLIAGATGTGKSITLRKIAESFSNIGVPVFLVDVKGGDFSGLACKGENTGKVAERTAKFGLKEDYFQSFPVTFWDVFGQSGIPLRLKISSMGAMLLSRLLDLNATQEGLLNLVFKVADDNGWELVDLKDLRALLKHVSDSAADYQSTYGNVSKASVGTIQRQLLQLEQDGGDQLFGEPAIELADFIKLKGEKGVINILAGEKLIKSTKTFSALLLWLLAEMFQEMPESGDLDKPKFVMFFDEAHLLFNNGSPELIEQIEQVVRLIRSKGVGVYFCTQSPIDLPEAILGQLGNRVQHALRAFTPKDQKAVKSAAQTFRANPGVDVINVISTLGVGEALISFLDEKGMPNPVEQTTILPPASQLTPLSNDELQKIINSDEQYSKYKTRIDNYSAAEALEANQVKETQPETVNSKSTTIPASKGTQDTGASGPNVVTGFLHGVFGLRKDRNAGVGYDVSNQLGKEVKSGLSKVITRSILGIIKRK